MVDDVIGAAGGIFGVVNLVSEGHAADLLGAAGNYVKIVQRVRVKIDMDNPPRDVALGPGMSVVPTVRIDPTPSLYERLMGRL